MSEWKEPRAPNQVLRDRIRDDDSVIIERLAIVLLIFWLGGLLMVTLAATGSFQAVDTSMEKPSAAVVKSMARLGAETTRDLLRDQSSEVNRQLFVTWGWVQLGVMGVIFGGLLFMSNAGKRPLAMAFGLTALAGLMAGVLIPGMVRIGREMRAAPTTATTDLTENFKRLHQAFGAIEIAAAVLALLLIGDLLRRRSRARR